MAKASSIIFESFKGTAKLGVTLTQGQRFRLLRLELHLSAAPTTSGDFTMALDAIQGDIFDNVIYKRDLSVGSVKDLLIPFGEGWEYEKDDKIDIAYTNADAKTWGMRAVLELLEK